MPDASVSFISRITKHLYTAEMILTGLLTAGILLPKMDVDSSMVVLIAVGGLAIVFFLHVYSPPEVPATSHQLTFRHLLYLSVLPKVMWIGCSVGTIGILFFLLDLSKGYAQMLLVGSTTLAIALLISGYFFLMREKYIHLLIPVLYRAVPVLLICVYLLLV